MFYYLFFETLFSCCSGLDMNICVLSHCSLTLVHLFLCTPRLKTPASLEPFVYLYLERSGKKYTAFSKKLSCFYKSFLESNRLAANFLQCLFRTSGKNVQTAGANREKETSSLIIFCSVPWRDWLHRPVALKLLLVNVQQHCSDLNCLCHKFFLIQY